MSESSPQDFFVLPPQILCRVIQSETSCYLEYMPAGNWLPALVLAETYVAIPHILVSSLSVSTQHCVSSCTCLITLPKFPATGISDLKRDTSPMLSQLIPTRANYKVSYMVFIVFYDPLDYQYSSAHPPHAFESKVSKCINVLYTTYKKCG